MAIMDPPNVDYRGNIVGMDRYGNAISVNGDGLFAYAGLNELPSCTQHELLTSGTFGHLWTADIHISSRTPAVVGCFSADLCGQLSVSIEEGGLARVFHDDEREAIISEALSTEEGRWALANAMLEPIRTQLNYQSIGRKMLMVEELPQGAMARYERDVKSVATVISRRGDSPFCDDPSGDGQEVFVPTFEIVSNPTISMAEIKQRRFWIVDRTQIAAKEAVQMEEDSNIFSDLLAAVNGTCGGGRKQLIGFGQGRMTVECGMLSVEAA